MKELLKRWAEYEWDRCRQMDESAFAVLIGRRWYLVYGKTRLLMEKAYIQLAVQQAIEARGWSWSLAWHAKQHSASVFDHDERHPYEGDISAAEAILTAYLKLLESYYGRSVR